LRRRNRHQGAVVKLKVTPAGQLVTKTPFVNGIEPVTTPIGQVGAVSPGDKVTPGLYPNNDIAAIEALYRIRKNPTGAAGAAAASIKVNGVVMSVAEVG
jgi:hypothetical protein